jgi:hypothetical protein
VNSDPGYRKAKDTVAKERALKRTAKRDILIAEQKAAGTYVPKRPRHIPANAIYKLDPEGRDTWSYRVGIFGGICTETMKKREEV